MELQKRNSFLLFLILKIPAAEIHEDGQFTTISFVAAHI